MTGEKKFNAWIPNFGAKGWGITLTCFVFFIFFTFWNSVTNTLFGIFGEQYGWQQTDMSFVITVAGWISLVAVVLFGTLGRKIGAKNVSMIGLVGSAVGFIILATMNSFAMFAVGVIVFYFCMVATRPSALACWVPHGSRVPRAPSWASLPSVPRSARLP